jgi:hypothetical protein
VTAGLMTLTDVGAEKLPTTTAADAEADCYGCQLMTDLFEDGASKYYNHISEHLKIRNDII